MSTLIVVGFKKDMLRASKVLNELVDMNYDWTIDLHDAVAAYRDYNGKLRIDASYQMTTGQGAALGGFFGSLIGLTLGAIAAPVTAGASAVAGIVAAGALGGGALGATGGAFARCHPVTGINPQFAVVVAIGRYGIVQINGPVIVHVHELVQHFRSPEHVLLETYDDQC
jgi:uncharacterized membrane protein